MIISKDLMKTEEGGEKLKRHVVVSWLQVHGSPLIFPYDQCIPM